MAAYAGNYTKAAGETVDLQISWADVLGSDTIASHVWTVPAGITKVSESNTTTLTRIRISGGTALTEYILTSAITTATGQVLDQSIKVLVDPALTPDQLGDMQADLGIDSAQTVFTDGELNRLYVRAGQNYDLAVVMGYRQLLAQSNKLHSYSAGAVSESLGQIRANLKDMLAYWENKAGIFGATLSSGTFDLGLDTHAAT